MELLVPAQGPEQLDMAIHFGAQAAYLAAPRWGMRAGARNFSEDELAQAVQRAHLAGVAVHLTLNTVMTDDDIDELPAFLHRVDEMGVNAAIVADLGAMALVQEHAPHVALHVSTQASAMNAQAVMQYVRLGAQRIVLAREMTLAQIAELRRRVPKHVELEVFAHGSMCVAYSGRCLLSAELMGPNRSANSGGCAQPCRWGWKLVEERSGQEIPVETDGRASYLLSSSDLCLLEHLDKLEEAGVDAIKIEGRSKGSYYTACVTNAYRHVLDGDDPSLWMPEVEQVSHRPYSTGFLFGSPSQRTYAASYARERTMVGVVRSCRRAGDAWEAEVVCRNKAAAGRVLDVLSPGYPVRTMRLEGEGGLATNGESYVLRMPFAVSPWDLLCLPN